MTNSRLRSAVLVVFLGLLLLSAREALAQQKCPENQVFSNDPIALSAKACNEDGAKRKIYKELLKRADDLRREKKAGDCAGSCRAGDCTLTTPIGENELTCAPAAVKGCEDGVGSACTFTGRIRAECLCAI